MYWFCLLWGNRQYIFIIPCRCTDLAYCEAMGSIYLLLTTFANCEAVSIIVYTAYWFFLLWGNGRFILQTSFANFEVMGSIYIYCRAQALCESWGGHPGLPVPNTSNRLYGLCGHKATLGLCGHKATLGLCGHKLIKQQWTWRCLCTSFAYSEAVGSINSVLVLPGQPQGLSLFCLTLLRFSVL